MKAIAWKQSSFKLLNMLKTLSNSVGPRANSYRPEIDGLRAFALAGVILNHFNEKLMPSGYLGVDIFFVISGYVITSSLVSRKSENLTQFIGDFYARRVKRLVPALVAFVIIMSALSSLILTDATAEINLGIRSLFGISNLELYRSRTDYFAGSADLNPFTHTWSLGVEEQFYLLFPFLIWFSGFSKPTPKGSRNLFITILLLSTTSLLSFVYLYKINQPAAYFLMPPRFWEMAVGCLIFIIYKKYNEIEKMLGKLPPLLIILLMVGIMLLPVKFAVQTTLSIVLLSLLLFPCLKEGTAGYVLLTNKKVVYIGLLSYSLYLWHWGILFLSRWTIGIHWWSVPFQLALIFIVAYVSYIYIETPIRHIKFSKSIFVIASGLILTFASTAILMVLNQKPVLSRVIKDDKLGGKMLLEQSKSCEVAFINSGDYEKGVKLSRECGESLFVERPTLYVLGDSHSHQYFDVIAEFAKRMKYNYVFSWGTGCIFPAALVISNEELCYSRQKQVEHSLLNTIKKDDIVLVANALNVRFNKSSVGNFRTKDGLNVNVEDAAKVFKEKFVELSNDITGKGAKIILYIDTIHFPRLQRGELCQSRWFRPTWAISDSCLASLKDYEKDVNQYFNWRNDWQNGKNKILWNSYENNLSCTNGTCNASRFRDSNHINLGYAHHHFTSFVKQNKDLFSLKTKM